MCTHTRAHLAKRQPGGEAAIQQLLRRHRCLSNGCATSGALLASTCLLATTDRRGATSRPARARGA
eukprot:COSAG03_NODE_12038_length_564_cov_1.595699_1_plen_65_part_10